MRLKQIALLATLFALVLSGFSYAGWALIGSKVLVFTVAVSAAAVLAAVLATYRVLRYAIPWHFRSQLRQVDALANVYAVISPRYPMPAMSDAAIHPDFASLLIGLTYEHRPATVVELGCGVSTLIIGYCLEKLGNARMYSYDHLKEYADRTQHQLRMHGLEGVAEVGHAPLKEVSIGDERWQWYDPAIACVQTSIDLLIIDGPPAALGPIARYPALPLLHERLSEKAIIVLDDANRSDERAIVDRWMKEFKGFQRREVLTAKGAVVLQRGS